MRNPRIFAAGALLCAAALACDDVPNLVGRPAVASVTVTPAAATLSVGDSLQLGVTTVDASNTVLMGRLITWASSNPAVATVTTNGLVQAIAVGSAIITATSEGRSGSAVITVTTPAATCTPASALKLAVGDIRALIPAQIASLCVGGLGESSEYVLIPFNNSNVPTSTTNLQLTSVGTIAATTLTSNPPSGPRSAVDSALLRSDSIEMAFHIRERTDIGGPTTRARVIQPTNIPANPVVGSVVPLNADLSGNSCTTPPVLHPARVVAVLKNVIIFIDTLAPPGGYTDAELIAFGTAFDTLGVPVAETNFGAPTDIDGNGRVAVFFTPGVNQFGAWGAFGARDLFEATEAGCIASNEGEIFYMAVPDPNETINSDFTSKAQLARFAHSIMIHEQQHLINASRRLFVNNAPDWEEVWLDEGLSHIAQELLYYATSGNAPLQNIDAARIQSSQAQLDAFGMNQVYNFSFLASYLLAPESSSPFSPDDASETRGAIWQLLRYAADQKGGNQQGTWFALVNSTTSGQANFNTVFGDIINETRGWAIAQFTDDAGFTVPPRLTSPSWDYRNIFPEFFVFDSFPLETHAPVAGTTLPLALVGGGAAYVRFGINAGVAATVTGTSGNQPPPSNIEMILVRTK
jgi:hypothetical protein